MQRHGTCNCSYKRECRYCSFIIPILINLVFPINMAWQFFFFVFIIYACKDYSKVYKVTTEQYLLYSRPHGEYVLFHLPVPGGKDYASMGLTRGLTVTHSYI